MSMLSDKDYHALLGQVIAKIDTSKSRVLNNANAELILLY